MNAVSMVEAALKIIEGSTTTATDLRLSLHKQINLNVLKNILTYFEESNKIAVSIKGITWIHNPSPNLRQAIKKGLEL